MAPEVQPVLRRITFILLALAAMAVEVAVADTRPIVTSLGLATVWVVIAAVASLLIPVPAAPDRQPPRLVLLFLVSLTAAPFLVEPLQREWSENGYPLDLQMVFALRNAGLGLAACSGWLMCLRLACVVSLFLTLFSTAMTNHPAVLVILGLYTVVGSVWLMLSHWSGLRKAFIPPERTFAVEVQERRERLPKVTVIFAVAIVGCVGGLILTGPQTAVHALGEWVPTSGGTGSYDPFARGGINDGDDETSGDNAKSTGMTQTESFLESPLPSLYDVANDMYGPPHKPPKDQESSIALDAFSKVQPSHKRPPDNLRPNRKFPTGRKSPRKPNTPLSRSARAIFEVEGRTPLHVRVVAFDSFDGQAWHEAPMYQNGLVIQKEPTTNWMTVSGLEISIFAESESHQFKITNPEGSLIPTPPHLARFRVGKVNRASFFGWSHDRVLKFAGRKTPSSIVVETECRTVDPRRLSDIVFSYPLPTERFDYHSPPPDLNPKIVSLAHSWVEGVPQGWPQIAAIVERLRTDYALDPAYSTPSFHVDPLAHFLLESQCGPDYQFASAAAVLLRVVGYRSRLVSGFYVHPDHFDPETKHTPVVKEDLHFWPEVMLPNGDWLVLEPTPGYEVSGPKYSLTEQIKIAAGILGAWALRNAVALIIGLMAVSFLWVRRREILDAIATRSWRWFPGRTWREQVDRLARLLERRGRWAGTPRASDQTVAAWLRTTLPETLPNGQDLGQLSQMTEWASYAPNVPPPWCDSEALAVCSRVLDFWTVRRWRNVALPANTSGVGS